MLVTSKKLNFEKINHFMNNFEIFTLCATLGWAPKQPKMLIPATKIWSWSGAVQVWSNFLNWPALAALLWFSFYADKSRKSFFWLIFLLFWSYYLWIDSWILLLIVKLWDYSHHMFSRKKNSDFSWIASLILFAFSSKDFDLLKKSWKCMGKFFRWKYAASLSNISIRFRF